LILRKDYKYVSTWKPGSTPPNSLNPSPLPALERTNIFKPLLL